jgi:hypothetical protein
MPTLALRIQRSEARILSGTLCFPLMEGLFRFSSGKQAKALTRTPARDYYHFKTGDFGSWLKGRESQSI